MFFLCSLCYGNQGNEAYAKSVQQKLDLENFQDLAKNIEIFVKNLPAKGKGCKGCGSKVQNIEPISVDDKNGILIFVSFSMPKASLIELNNQAKQYNAKLILRGVYKNSFLKMKEKILEINSNGLTADIDPQAFKQYNIMQVPTFVLLKNGEEVGRLVGNVTLDFAHKKLNEANK